MKKLDIEKELLESLLASRELFDSKKFIFIKSFFEKKFSMISNVFILHHHFGQVEEYYVFMVNGEFIVPVEIYNNKIVEYEIYDPGSVALFAYRTEFHKTKHTCI